MGSSGRSNLGVLKLQDCGTNVGNSSRFIWIVVPITWEVRGSLQSLEGGLVIILSFEIGGLMLVDSRIEYSPISPR